ncbi:choline transporter-like protein 3 [Striga asiatica]|uniref:Choline transporter-like protein 3 n=1 Tax=Striga asiatica TaxID=4170 RepID=A0A5A7Q302_STRAF|nr:choline transporter-like protein 3 [Striga asiatica]
MWAPPLVRRVRLRPISLSTISSHRTSASRASLFSAIISSLILCFSISLQIDPGSPGVERERGVTCVWFHEERPTRAGPQILTWATFEPTWTTSEPTWTTSEPTWTIDEEQIPKIPNKSSDVGDGLKYRNMSLKILNRS